MEKRIGKIQKISFGFGGYQDAQFGVSVWLGSDKDSWGVSDFKGFWATKRSDRCKWTEEERLHYLGEMCIKISELLTDAKKVDINQLVGVPIEVTIDGNLLKEWRILTEVI